MNRPGSITRRPRLGRDVADLADALEIEQFGVGGHPLRHGVRARERVWPARNQAAPPIAAHA